MPIQIPCSKMEHLWTGISDLAIILHQDTGEDGDGKWWSGGHMKEVGKQNCLDCCSVTANLVEYSR